MKKIKNLGSLKRRAPKIRPAQRILLVCEGEKTEKIYFELFLDQLRAANIDLEIAKKEYGTDPHGIVKYAQNRMKIDSSIDKCYCIFDRDTHDDNNFNNAIIDAKRYQKKLGKHRVFETIISYPCFEIWFIFHFSNSTRPYTQSGSRSPADCVISALKQFPKMSEYRKNNSSLISSLLDKTETAIKNSRQVYDAAVKSGNYNPSTTVHHVVTELRKYIT